LVQLVLPKTIGAEPLTMPVAAAMLGIFSLIVARSEALQNGDDEEVAGI
jgi:hypothetical protein